MPSSNKTCSSDAIEREKMNSNYGWGMSCILMLAIAATVALGVGLLGCSPAPSQSSSAPSGAAVPPSSSSASESSSSVSASLDAARSSSASASSASASSSSQSASTSAASVSAASASTAEAVEHVVVGRWKLFETDTGKVGGKADRELVRLVKEVYGIETTFVFFSDETLVVTNNIMSDQNDWELKGTWTVTDYNKISIQIYDRYGDPEESPYDATISSGTMAIDDGAGGTLTLHKDS